MSDFVEKTCGAKTKDGKCGKTALYSYEKLLQCPIHIKQSLGKKTIAEVKAMKGVAFRGVLCVKSDSAPTKETTSNASKAEKKIDDPVKPAPKNTKTGSSQPVEKPSKKENGTCSGKKGDGKTCGTKASYTCPETCEHCSGAPFCGTHWNSKHKSASSGKKVADEDRCEHTYASGAKKGEQCTSKANGIDENGLRACGRHGVKKEASASGSTAVASTPLGNVNIAKIMFQVSETFLAHSVHAENQKSNEKYSPDYLVAFWLHKLNECVNVFSYNESDLLVLLANADLINPAGKDHEDLCGESFMTSLNTYLKGECNWVFALYEKFSTKEGEEGAKIKTFFDEIVRDFDYKAKASPAKSENSETKASKILSENSGKRSKKSNLDILEELQKQIEEDEVEEKKQSEKVVDVDEDVQDEGVQDMDTKEDVAEPDTIIVDDDDFEPSDDEKNGEAEEEDLFAGVDLDEGDGDVDENAEVIFDEDDEDGDLDDM